MKHIIKIKPAPASFVKWLQTTTTKDLIRNKTALFEAGDDKNKGKYADELWSAVANDNTKKIFIKTDLWLQLCREQGYICAYCGRNLDLNKQRIEHLEVKSENIHKTLDYNNLAAVCHSTNNQEGTHCDVKRENKVIYVYPTQKDCENRIYYDVNGKAIGNDNDANTTIDVLGLNANSNLVRDRKNYYQNAKQVIENYLQKHKFKKDANFCLYLNKISQKLVINQETKGITYREYCFVDYQLYKKHCPNVESLPQNKR